VIPEVRECIFFVGSGNARGKNYNPYSSNVKKSLNQHLSSKKILSVPVFLGVFMDIIKDVFITNFH